MLGMLKRHEVEILLKAGHAKSEVARLAGVSLCSVKRIAQESPVLHVDEVAERARRQIGRPSRVASFRNQVVGILQEEPNLATLEILRRVREAGYRGGKTALYSLVASLRPKSAKPLVRFEGLPGEFSQHDFGEVKVEFLNGACQEIHFFASRLKYSRFMRVSLVKDEAVESLVRTLAEHLANWGGRPLLCVFDRPKTIALEWQKNGEVTEWNPVFAYATLELGVGVELCWPYRAQQKGSVENLVGFVKSSFFKVRRFHDEEDLRQQLRDWHREVNEERPCRATGIIPALRPAEEAPRLRALKVEPEERKERYCPLWPQTAAVLKSFCQKRDLDLRTDSRVFLNHRAKPITRFGIRHILARCLRRACVQVPTLGKKRLHPHSVRHSTAVALLKSGVDLSTISHMLGHASPNTTNRYAKVDLEMKRQAIAKIKPVPRQSRTPLEQRPHYPGLAGISLAAQLMWS
jgi:transposase